MKRLIRYFLRGLLFIVPLAATAYVIVESVRFLDGLIPLDIPGLGILILIAGITVIGALGSVFLTRPIFEFFDSLLKQIPIINILYTSIKDLLSAFVGDKKKFKQAVKVKLNAEGTIYRLGFITQEDLSSLIGETDLVAVYLPHSYNFSGNLVLVPRANIQLIEGVNSADLMKFIVSGGVSSLEE